MLVLLNSATIFDGGIPILLDTMVMNMVQTEKNPKELISENREFGLRWDMFLHR